MNFLSQSSRKSSKQTHSFSLPNLKSSMTIYLMLVLIIVMALVCTLIESGRVSAITARLRSITYMAADSVFAEYAQPLFDRYGVMMLWMDEEEFQETLNGYIRENLDLAGTEAGMDMDLYGMRFQGSELTRTDWITDQGAKAFSEQVYEYMKIHAVEGIAETIFSQSDKFQQSEKVREVMGKLNEYQKDFSGIQNSAVDIYEKAQKIKDLSENPKTILEEIEGTLDRFDSEDLESANQEFAMKKAELYQAQTELTQEISDMQATGDSYSQKLEEAKQTMQEMRTELDINEKEMDPELYQALQEHISEFESGGETGLLQTINTADEYQNALNGMNAYFAGTGESLTAENAEAYRNLTAEYKNQLESVDLSQLDTGQVLSASEQATPGFILRVNNKFKTGILDLLAGEISDKAVNKETFPSETCTKDNSSTEEDTGFVDKSMQKALFCEYIREHFGCYTNVQENSALDYETEYILGGKDNDRDNLSSVATKLVLLRSGANLCSILMDSSKKTEIRLLALEIIGFTGQVYLIKAAEGIITVIWALAEALIDVRQLFHGKKVPIIKRTGDWNLSLTGLKNFTGDEEGGAGNENGMDYQAYLMILLMLQNREKQLYRTMDVIQANMCVAETENFRIKDCMVGVELEASFQAPGVFASLPIVRRSFDSGGGGYGFQFQQEYAY